MKYYITLRHGIVGRSPLFRFYEVDGIIWSSEDPILVEEKLVQLMLTNPTNMLDVVIKTGVTFSAILGQ